MDLYSDLGSPKRHVPFPSAAAAKPVIIQHFHILSTALNLYNLANITLGAKAELPEKGDVFERMEQVRLNVNSRTFNSCCDVCRNTKSSA